MTEFSNSPIMNAVLEKVRTEILVRAQSKSPLPVFELENNIGKAIQKKLEFMSDSSFEAICKFENHTLEKFSEDVIGPIEFTTAEKEKSKRYIINLANEKTGR